ncbi:MAG: hypothetical protein KF744_05385 [Taibaiella sp.]|nr:hypothetical protein [Taibaiella sp.]
MKKIGTAVISSLLLASCGEPQCTNTNSVFDKYPVDGKEYNAELLRVLQHQDGYNLSFWINRYISVNNRHYMQVKVHGDDLCANMVFEIGGVKRLENFITIAGKSYSGAELKGVTYTVDSIGGSIHFVMTGLTRVID